jgi:hypothetical protein
MLDFYWTRAEAEKKIPKPTARLYHHWDGYPSSRIADIKKAVDLAVSHYKKDAGFSYHLTEIYAGDLAAFYVLANKDSAGNIEIDNFIHGDIEFLYQVVSCDSAFPGISVRILTPDYKNHPMMIPCKKEDIKKIGKYPAGHDRYNGWTMKNEDGTITSELFNPDSFWDHPAISRMAVLAKDHSDPDYKVESGDWATLATQIKRHCKEDS